VKIAIFHTPCMGVAVGVLLYRLVYGVATPPQWWKKFDDMFSRFDRTSSCDRRTDGRMEILRHHSPRYA